MAKVTAIGEVVGHLSLLSDQSRLRMLRVLELEELTVGEVADVLQMPQSTASRHLGLLAKAGWLVKRSERTATFYRLLTDDLDDEARTLWLAVRDRIENGAEAEDDRRRLRGVLAERRTDSLSFFGRVAGEWDDYREDLFGDRFTAQALLGLVPPTWTVADVGCGTGNATELLAGRVERIIAIDQSEPMLEAAQRRLGDDQRGVEFRRGAVESLPLEDGSVDAAVCSLVLHHVAEPAAAAREMRRVLRREKGGGVLLVIDMVEHDREIFRHQMGHTHLGFSAASIRGLLSDAGFARVDVVDLPAAAGSKGPGLFAARAAI